MHEVVVLPATLRAAERQEAAGRPAWRISSTLFAHVASDRYLTPLRPFASDEVRAAYPAVTAGDQVMSVLRKIRLSTEAEEETEKTSLESGES